jgi:hypothetical protein
MNTRRPNLPAFAMDATSIACGMHCGARDAVRAQPSFDGDSQAT